jgi:outer membrane protein TolC
MKIALTLSIALLLSTNAAAMTQSEFVDRLQNTHPFFTQQGFDQQVSQLNYISSTANQDWVLSGLIYTDSIYQKPENISAQKNLTKTGASLTLANSWSDDTNSTNIFSIDYTHPLLKNYQGVNDQLASDLSEVQININTLNRAQSAEKFVLSQLFKLVDLSYAQQQLALTTQRLELSQQELSLVKEKLAQSVVDQVDVFLQEDVYQRVLQKQLQAEQELDLLKEELSIILNMSPKLVHSSFDLYELYKANLDNTQIYLRENTTEMKIAKLEQVLLQRQLLSDKNNTQVQLDLKLGASNKNDNDWNIGLGLSYPLGDTKARSDLEKTQITLSKTKENIEEQLINLTVKARVLNKKLTHLTKLLNTYQTRIKIAESRALAEKKRYELGNSQVSFVISAQNNVHDVNLAYAQAAVNYQKSVLEFKAVIDQLM